MELKTYCVLIGNMWNSLCPSKDEWITNHQLLYIAILFVLYKQEVLPLVITCCQRKKYGHRKTNIAWYASCGKLKIVELFHQQPVGGAVWGSDVALLEEIHQSLCRLWEVIAWPHFQLVLSASYLPLKMSSLNFLFLPHTHHPSPHTFMDANLLKPEA